MNAPKPYNCLVCGTPTDSPECDRCVTAHDHTITPLNDI